MGKRQFFVQRFSFGLTRFFAMFAFHTPCKQRVFLGFQRYEIRAFARNLLTETNYNKELQRMEMFEKIKKN